MTYSRKLALAAGVFFVITFIPSIPALFLYAPVLNNPDFIVSAGADASVRWGAFLEVFLGLAGIGSAVALYPIVKRPPGLRFGTPSAARILRATLRARGHRHDPGVHLGAVVRHLAYRQGIQSICIGFLVYRLR